MNKFLFVLVTLRIAHLRKLSQNRTASSALLSAFELVVFIALKGELGELEFYFRKIPLHQ